MLLVTATLVFTLTGCGSEQGSEEDQPEFQPATVQRGDITIDITAAGNLALSRTEDLAVDLFYGQSGASGTKGTIGEVLVEEGDSVTEGQVLVTIDREEWYTFRNFGRDLHVILVQDTDALKKEHKVDKFLNSRPPFPQTWARKQGKGRVFYTSFGHVHDVWTNAFVQGLVLGGFAWAMRNAEADVAPNIEKVTPGAWDVPKKA